MRQALLLIKVALLLVTFASLGGAHAAASGQQNFVAQSGDVALGAPTLGGEDKKVALAVVFIALFLFIFVAPWFQLTLVLPTAYSTHPSARAPPSTSSV